MDLLFQPEYKIADPICTYVFSILVVLTTVRILCDTGVIILEGKILTACNVSCVQVPVLHLTSQPPPPPAMWAVSGILLIFRISVLAGSSKLQQSSGVFDLYQHDTGLSTAHSLPSQDGRSRTYKTFS